MGNLVLKFIGPTYRSDSCTRGYGRWKNVRLIFLSLLRSAATTGEQSDVSGGGLLETFTRLVCFC